MPFLYRHKINRRLYSLEFLVLDMRYNNRNAYRGIYATPYFENGDQIVHNFQNEGENYNPDKFILDNFEIVCEI